MAGIFDRCANGFWSFLARSTGSTIFLAYILTLWSGNYVAACLIAFGWLGMNERINEIRKGGV